jgi:hypothetical protein
VVSVHASLLTFHSTACVVSGESKQINNFKRNSLRFLQHEKPRNSKKTMKIATFYQTSSMQFVKWKNDDDENRYRFLLVNKKSFQRIYLVSNVSSSLYKLLTTRRRERNVAVDNVNCPCRCARDDTDIDESLVKGLTMNRVWLYQFHGKVSSHSTCHLLYFNPRMAKQPKQTIKIYLLTHILYRYIDLLKCVKVRWKGAVPKYR